MNTGGTLANHPSYQRMLEEQHYRESYYSQTRDKDTAEETDDVASKEMHMSRRGKGQQDDHDGAASDEDEEMSAETERRINNSLRREFVELGENSLNVPVKSLIGLESKPNGMQINTFTLEELRGGIDYVSVQITLLTLLRNAMRWIEKIAPIEYVTDFKHRVKYIEIMGTIADPVAPGSRGKMSSSLVEQESEFKDFTLGLQMVIAADFQKTPLGRWLYVRQFALMVQGIDDGFMLDFLEQLLGNGRWSGYITKLIAEKAAYGRIRITESQYLELTEQLFGMWNKGWKPDGKFVELVDYAMQLQGGSYDCFIVGQRASNKLKLVNHEYNATLFDGYVHEFGEATPYGFVGYEMKLGTKVAYVQGPIVLGNGEKLDPMALRVQRGGFHVMPNKLLGKKDYIYHSEHRSIQIYNLDEANYHTVTIEHALLYSGVGNSTNETLKNHWFFKPQRLKALVENIEKGGPPGSESEKNRTPEFKTKYYTTAAKSMGTCSGLGPRWFKIIDDLQNAYGRGIFNILAPEQIRNSMNTDNGKSAKQQFLQNASDAENLVAQLVRACKQMSKILWDSDFDKKPDGLMFYVFVAIMSKETFFALYKIPLMTLSILMSTDNITPSVILSERTLLSELFPFLPHPHIDILRSFVASLVETHFTKECQGIIKQSNEIHIDKVIEHAVGYVWTTRDKLIEINRNNIPVPYEFVCVRENIDFLAEGALAIASGGKCAVRYRNYEQLQIGNDVSGYYNASARVAGCTGVVAAQNKFHARDIYIHKYIRGMGSRYFNANEPSDTRSYRPNAKRPTYGSNDASIKVLAMLPSDIKRLGNRFCVTGDYASALSYLGLAADLSAKQEKHYSTCDVYNKLWEGGWKRNRGTPISVLDQAYTCEGNLIVNLAHTLSANVKLETAEYDFSIVQEETGPLELLVFPGCKSVLNGMCRRSIEDPLVAHAIKSK
jgi:hypothetical protein